jgi:triacylglycerol lipase
MRFGVSRRLGSKLGHARSVRAEVLATLREAFLMPRDLGPVVPDLRGDEDVVVLVHGFLATAGVFRPLRAALEEAGLGVASFSYAPGRSVASVASQLADVVRKIPARARVHIVGHSMGGVVARHYVHHLGGHERVMQTVSLASPFHGTPRARRFPWFVRDLHPDSRVLQGVRVCPPHVHVPHMSIVAGSDRLVPPDSARFPGAPFIVLPDRGHNALLFDRQVARIIVGNLRRSAAMVHGSTTRSSLTESDRARPEAAKA